jgi:hypothetical protein
LSSQLVFIVIAHFRIRHFIFTVFGVVHFLHCFPCCVAGDIVADFIFVGLWLAEEEDGGVSVEGVCGVGIAEKLWEEDFEDVDHVYEVSTGVESGIKTEHG